MTTPQPADEPGKGRRKNGRRSMTLYAEGEPMVWLTGGALAMALLMIVFMLAYVAFMGASNFWPHGIVEVKLASGDVHLGEVTRKQLYQPPVANIAKLPEDIRARVQKEMEVRDGMVERRLIRTGNYELTGTRFHWVSNYNIVEETLPEWAIIMERMEWGHFIGYPLKFTVDGEVVAETPETVWAQYAATHDQIRRRWAQRKKLETIDIGRANREEEKARLAWVDAQRQFEQGSLAQHQLDRVKAGYEEVFTRVRADHARITEEIRKLNHENERYGMVMRTSSGQETSLKLADIVRAYPANRLTIAEKTGIFFSRWREFLFDDPREANTEGGVYPAIIGTVTMTLVMTLFVVPFGVLAALYLREYAKSGPLVSSVRIAINNLAGVPSIVFGVFGLGFFCYIFGGYMDEWFYSARLPAPTFRKGGVLWASLTLALLTLPVVIVATEEALAAVPSSMREGSYACGASKWQTIVRIVLPRAMPGIMTGMILAMARGAGEVAPLMLVGAVKLAPDLPLDLSNWSGSFGPLWTGPIHLDRSFMHLGFHIYDVGFQSPDSEAARPMVFTTTLLLIGIIVTLNLSAMVLRTKLRKRFMTGAF